MESRYWPVIKQAYAGFNARDIDQVFAVMVDQVHWPKAFEGGHVVGKDAVSAYWLRQWSEINPRVEPLAISEREDGKLEVLVSQLVRDLEGNILFDGQTRHVYAFDGDMIVSMDVEAA
ncbi:ketosteroid isomerase [Pedobacter sp. GR22-6]|uniref:ketosteroid isomerase n=1 Tax=Pedobacter sp. GR22-6 TaxID=3127957 RepID=UPI00307EF946